MYNLSWEEAQKAMSEGDKVKHRHFCCDEWFQMINGVIYCEGEYNMSRWYKGDEWQKTGWTIVH